MNKPNLLLLLILAQAGCAGHLHVGSPLAQPVSSVSLELATAPFVVVDPETLAEIRNAFQAELVDAGIQMDKNGPKLVGHITQLEEGSALARWAVGGGAGRGSLVIAWSVEGDDGKQLATLRTESEVTGGLLGGSLKSGIHDAAEELSGYLVQPSRK